MPLPHSRPRASPPPFDTLSRTPCACRTLSSSLCDRVSRVSAPPRRGTRTSGLFHGGLEAWTPRETRGTHSRLDRCFSPAHGASSAPRCQYTSSRISARRRAPTAALVPGSDRGALFLGQNTRHSHFPVAALPLRAALGMPREAPRPTGPIEGRAIAAMSVCAALAHEHGVAPASASQLASPQHSKRRPIRHIFLGRDDRER
eukprot:COSAG01_NODE_10969_length_2037_cov_6.235810_3_plen_202_part_00